MFLGIGRFKLCQLYYTNTQIQFLSTFPIAKNHCPTLIWISPLLPSGHIITSDLNIINHDNTPMIISHESEYKEPQHINWTYNYHGFKS